MSNKYDTNYIDSILKEYSKDSDEIITSAINYSLFQKGKRLRPLFMLYVNDIFESNHDVLKPFMAAIEMIHTYSLIHDDLPAMDDDNLRRGVKTNHIVFGEANAILAGDGLLNKSIETVMQAFDYKDYTDEVVKASKVLYKCSGIDGMIGGQVLDIYYENKQIENMDEPYEILCDITKKKTSALIVASFKIGAIIGMASDKEIDIMEQVANNVGLAFQIQDDLLDIVGDEKTFGKTIGSDEKNNKSTFASILGVDKCKELVSDLTNEAISLLQSLNKDTKELEDIILGLINREK